MQHARQALRNHRCSTWRLSTTACCVGLLALSCGHAGPGPAPAPAAPVVAPEPSLQNLPPELKCARQASSLRLSASGQEIPEAFADNETIALRTWTCTNPKGSDFEAKLEALQRTNLALTHALARSFLRLEKYDCTKEDESISDCGSPGIVVGDVAPDARMGDPCLTRSLMRWALRKGGLGDLDIKAVRPKLVPLLNLREPERDLPQDVLDLADKLTEPVRLSLLLEAPPELAAEHIKGLSDPSLIALYQEKHLDAAVLALDRKVHHELVLEALADYALTTETRRTLLDHVSTLSGDDVTQALTEVADSGHCALSTEAALELKRRGDASHLPCRPKKGKDSAQALAWEICRLGFLPDSREAQARFVEFLPPKGEVTLLDDSKAEDEGGRRTCTRSGSVPCELPPMEGDVGIVCDEKSCDLQMQDWEIRLTFARAKNKRLYLVGIARRDLSMYNTC